MHNVKLIIAYDGTRYLGWQKTKMGPSIEEALQATVEQIVQHPVHLQAASRTDAGVHATGQVVNFLTSKTLNLSQFNISLNGMLPKDIAVRSVQLMPGSFHPTLDCTGKEYRYYACLRTRSASSYPFLFIAHFTLLSDRRRCAKPFPSFSAATTLPPSAT